MRRILMVLGGMFALMVGGFGVLALQAYTAAGQNQEAAVAAVRSISQDWSLAQSREHISPALLGMSDAPNVRRAFRVFKQFGPLVSAQDAIQTNYAVSTENGTTATVEFLGTFRNGVAKVTVQLRENAGRMKLFGLHMKPLSEVAPVAEEQA